ncbi:preprotein translocase subunit SecE [Collinsella sp. An2]|uniref:preprotein translocase subunit SecE n=1 Tax=Collinsella sp. An2 TaxID=1965585 RepID=UPI000B38CA83|nr:preprotein translocase subunit SecE [Collinsella sp. An2]OUP11049.1 preprotein translocase subunit SecE [Collinsella sp. An2]
MANKKNKKKAQQKSSQPAAAAAADAKVEKKAVAKKADAKGKPAKETSKAAKAKKNKGGKPGLFARAKKYLGSVRSEMRRVTWPSKKELINYSVAVCVSLVVVGVVIFVLDMAIGEGLALFAGLRG